jgi:flavin-dependent dehydrogenase
VRFDADVIVAGGGPIGLAAATYASRAGFSTIVVEQRPGTVDKACGEGLMPTAVASLRALGVRPPGQPFHGIRYVGETHCAEAYFSAGTGLGVRRTALHSSLEQRALSAGVRRVTAHVDDVRQDEASVIAAGLRGRWLLAADGLHSGVRRAVGLDARPGPSPGRIPRRYGLRRHVTLEPWTDLVEVHWSPDAEAYVTPVAPDRVGIALLFSGQGRFDDWLARFPSLAERLRGAPAASRTRGAGPLLQHASGRVSGRVLLVGDAAGYVDALTGEGINVGLASAAAAVECIRRGRPYDYELQWTRVSRAYRMVTSGLLWASSQPLLRGRIVPAAQRLPSVFTAIVNRLG